jgi:hypothetical protein
MNIIFLVATAVFIMFMHPFGIPENATSYEAFNQSNDSQLNMQDNFRLNNQSIDSEFHLGQFPLN